MPWPTPRTEPYWTIPAEVWAEARQQIARIAVPCHRQAFAALVDHLEAGWEIVSAIQVEADRIIHSQMRAPAVARDVAGFLECEPTDNYRYVVEMCLEAIPGEDGRWIDAMQDVDGECEEIVRQVRMVYLATANPAFPPLLVAVVKDAYPRLAKWLRKLPAVLRPVDRVVGDRRGGPTHRVALNGYRKAEEESRMEASPRRGDTDCSALSAILESALALDWTGG